MRCKKKVTCIEGEEAVPYEFAIPFSKSLF